MRAIFSQLVDLPKFLHSSVNNLEDLDFKYLQLKLSSCKSLVSIIFPRSSVKVVEYEII